MSECAESRTLSAECAAVRTNYLTCKRGQLDMRSRIRGNKGY